MYPLKNTQQQIKENHLRMIFKAINEKEPVSRIEVTRLTGLSATTVSSLVEELIHRGLIIESGVKKTGTSGRRAVLLTLNPYGGCFAGVSILAGRVSVSLYDLKFNRLFCRTKSYNSADHLADVIVNILGESEVQKKLLGVALGVPGVINSEAQEVMSSTVIDKSSARMLVKTLRQALSIENVILCNNSSLNAYAEKEFGGHGVQNIVSVDIGDGVGAGIVINGEIFSGFRGLAGELGHITIDKHGEKCKCGGNGCLETRVSVPSVLCFARTMCPGVTDINGIIAELDRGNDDLLKVIDAVARDLSFGISTVINFLDPEAVIIGGEISPLKKYLLSPLMKYAGEKMLSERKQPIIAFSSIEDDAVALGGAKYMFDKMFISQT